MTIGGAKMKIKSVIKIFIALILILTILSLSNQAMAISDANYYKPNQTIEQGEFINRVGNVLGWIRTIGMLVAVIALVVIGIKYIFGSVEGKAEYKKTIFPYLIGCFMLMTISIIIGFIGDFVID